MLSTVKLMTTDQFNSQLATQDRVSDEEESNEERTESNEQILCELGHLDPVLLLSGVIDVHMLKLTVEDDMKDTEMKFSFKSALGG